MNKGVAGRAGWQAKRLDEVCEIIMGQSPDGDSYNVTGEGVPLINGPVEFSQGAFGKTTRSKFTTEPTKLCRENDLILCVRGSTTGRMNIAGFDACVGRGVAAIRAKEYQPWINHFISSKRDEIHRLGTGATFPNVSGTMLNDLQLPFPPLPEQRRIVGILDEAFDGIAAAKANAEKNLQNARDLFESHLQAVFTQRVKGWVEKRLEEVADANCTLSYGIVQPGDEYPDGLPVVRPTDLTTKVIQLSGLKRIDPELAGGYRRTSLYGRELLLCVRGSTGVVSIASAELVGANVTRGIVPIRFDADLLTPDFGFYLMSSGSVQSQIREKTYGAALMQINIRDLRNIMLSFPALKEQKVIAAKLDALSAKTQRLESIYQQKLAALGALKKSLLDQAFTGAL
jgi:type I restriction enzyme S subunit